ncbi:DUF4384 domain-containing protein [Deinococcus sonorensis]|uniref:DUF4384 domain-containing protein n=2 Tax=Deinococcus sonorensis TaxID=309891 RepID=A0AAU7U8C1_9DEIO
MKKLLTLSTALSAALIPGVAAAAPKISAQSIIVNPAPSNLVVRVYVDRDTSGQQTPDYQVGDPIKITTVVNQDAYVYLFNLDGTGKVTQILPNKFASGGNFLKANTSKTFPAAGDNFTFTVDEPAGLNKVLAVASKTQLNLSQITEFQASQNGGQLAAGKVEGQQQLAQALSIVVNPLPQNSWVTDTALFNVAPAQAVTTGSLFVGSSVAGSIVYLNGRQVGAANTTYTNLQPGTYQLRVATPGYSDFVSNISVRSGALVNVNVEPTAVAAPAPVQPVRPARATLTLRSSVTGAVVYLDGRQVGTIQNGGLNITTTLGSHEVVVIAPGYRTFSNVYNVTQSGTITINPTR